LELIARLYYRRITLRRFGRHAIPAVDELATMPLNFWAVEQGDGNSS
jgi:hypothetical protein